MNNTQIPRHCELSHFPVTGNQLVVGGFTLEQLVEKVGSTPFYAYDRAVIDRRIQLLRAQLPATLKLHYAVKANPMPAVVQHIAQLVDGLDIASVGEMRLALASETPAHSITFTGPGKGLEELSAAIEAGVTINLESEIQMQQVAQLAEAAGQRPRVMVRINPDFELKSSGMLMGGRATPFGTDVEQVPDLLKKLVRLDMEFVGFHIFSGSQNLRAEAIIESQNAALDLATRLAEQAPKPIQILNLGGGFGIPYFPGDKPLELAPIADNLSTLTGVAARELPGTKLALELGRYLVGEAGVYVSRVIDKKLSRGQTFLITDGGLHHHLAASGNFGQVVRKNFPVVIGNKMTVREKEIVNIVGRLCTPLDLLADKMKLPTAGIGDFVVILQSGAYGLTASPNNFLSHPPATEILL